MVTTRENPTVITSENTIKSKHNDTSRYQNTHKKRQQDKKQGTVDLQNNQKTVNKMAIVSPNLSIITLNINKLNSPIKRQNG